MKRQLRVLIAGLIALLVGCTHFEVGIEQPAAPLSPATATRHSIIATPTIEPTPTATATQLPTLRSTATPITPLPTPSPTVPLSQIINFTVDPTEVNPGETVTLHWETTDAAYVDLSQYLPGAVPYSDTVRLPPNGELSQTIPEQERQWHAFELAASNSARTVTQDVKVVIRCPDTYFFGLLPETDRAEWSCPDGPAITANAAEQAFENGRMLWTEHDLSIYVLLNDGTYHAYDDTWTAAEPDRDPAIIPPADRYQPVRGFGKVWRTQPDMRDQLGWALALERGFETQLQGGWVQCCSVSVAVNRPIYLRVFDGQIVRLWAGDATSGQWSEFTP